MMTATKCEQFSEKIICITIMIKSCDRYLTGMLFCAGFRSRPVFGAAPAPAPGERVHNVGIF